MQLVSFEEVIACTGAIAAGLIAFLTGRHWLTSPLLESWIVIAVSGLVLAIGTSTRFVLSDETINYGSMFWSDSVRLSEIERISVRPNLGLIPGRNVLFHMRPGSRVAMSSVRIGIWSWPRADDWVAAANSAILKVAERPG